MLFAFENGKVAKVPLKSYETKTNRKKLINAYSDASPIVGIIYTPTETDVLAETSNAKLLCFNTESVNMKTTRDTQGVKALTLKKNATLKSICLASESKVADPKKYYTKNIPAAGFFLKASDKAPQMSLFED